MQSEKERYYKVDEGYDKNVYENTCMSRFIIFLVFVAFYTFNILMTWGLFEFGMWNATDYTTFSVVIFLVTLVGLAIMIISGNYANRKSHFADFLNTKISEKKAHKEEEETRKKQEEDYAQRMKEREGAEGARTGTAI